MFASHMIYLLGIVVSIINVCFWGAIIKSQLSRKSSAPEYAKRLLLVFTVGALLSNAVPIWFDIVQLQRSAHPNNLVIAYSTSQYLFRTLAACMFYLIWRY